eukprot:UN00220
MINDKTQITHFSIKTIIPIQFPKNTQYERDGLSNNQQYSCSFMYWPDIGSDNEKNHFEDNNKNNNNNNKNNNNNNNNMQNSQPLVYTQTTSITPPPSSTQPTPSPQYLNLATPAAREVKNDWLFTLSC